MNSFIDAWLAPGTWLLADWSLRWGILIVLVAGWFAVRPPRTAASRILVLRLVLVTGLLLPCMPALWGPLSPTPTPASAPRGASSKPQIAANTRARVAEKRTTFADGRSPTASSRRRFAIPRGRARDTSAVSQPLRSNDRLGWIRGSILGLSMVWVLGAFAGTIRLLSGWVWLAGLRRTASPVAEANFRRELDDWITQLGVARSVELAEHGGVELPILIGGFRPAILVPCGWRNLSATARRAILLHELTHVRRRDDTARLMEELVRCGFWFHPLVHWLLTRIGTVREELCDAAVVHQGIAPRELAAVLLETCRRCGAGRAALAVRHALPFVRGRSLHDRIQILMEEKSMSRWIVRPTAKSAIALVIVVVGLCVAVGSFGARAAAPEQPDEKQVPGSDGLPTIQEIQSAYRANFARMLPLSITYRVSQLQGVGEIEQNRHQLKSDEFFLNLDENAPIQIDGREPTAEERAGFKRMREMMPGEIERLKEALEPEAVKRRLSEPIVNRCSFLTDGDAFHARWPFEAKGKAEQSMFPGSVSPPENLVKLFGSMKLASWSKANDPPLRGWYGGQGKVAAKLGDRNGSSHFPPLGFVKLEWTHEIDFHDLDVFMSHETGAYRVVGREQLQGKPVLVVDGCFSPEGNGLKERVRAWIDPQQGHLPLRIERSYVDAAGKHVSNAGPNTEVLEVREVAGGFYPIRMKRQQFEYDATANEKQRYEKEAGRIPKDAPAPPLLPGRTFTWEVAEVTPHEPIDPAVLRLEFPAGTLYQNEITNLSYHVGDPTPIPDPPKPLQPGEAAPELKVTAWADGGKRSLANFRGQVVVIDFCDLSSPECIEMASLFKAIEAKYASKGVVFVEIQPAGTDLEKLREFQKQHGRHALIAVDQGKVAASSATAFAYAGGFSAGIFLVIGRDGNIAFNPTALEEDATIALVYRAAKACSIPWPIDEKAPKEELDRQNRQIFESLIGEQIDQALGKP